MLFHGNIIILTVLLLITVYYKSNLAHDAVDWFVVEVLKIEIKVAFHFKNTNEDNILTEKYEEHYRDNNIFRFCDKGLVFDVGRYHCPLASKYRGPADNICNINVTQKQSKFISFVFHNFSNNDCHVFFKKLVDKKYDKIKFDIKPQTNEENIPLTNGCKRFLDSY